MMRESSERVPRKWYESRESTEHKSMEVQNTLRGIGAERVGPCTLACTCLHFYFHATQVPAIPGYFQKPHKWKGHRPAIPGIRLGAGAEAGSMRAGSLGGRQAAWGV